MTPSRDGLIAEYLFSGNAEDSSGHGRHGQVVGATPAPDRFGNPNAAYAFDGKNDYVIVVEPPAMTAEALTISVWDRFDEGVFRGWSRAVIAQDNGDDFWRSYREHRRILQLCARDRQITWHRMGWGGDDAKARRLLVPGAWCHVAATVAGNTHRLYINGDLEDTKESWFASSPTEPLYIGRKAPPDKRMFFSGTIDDVRIYDRALTAEEIRALHDEGGWVSTAPREYQPEPEPLAWQDGAWTSLDIDTLVPGATAVDGEQIALTAGGQDIWGTSDGFRYVYREVRGDFSATAALLGVPDTDDWAKAGIMVRRSLQSDAANAMVFGVTRFGPRAQWRAETGGTTEAVGAGQWQDFQPVHLQMVRKGQTVSFFTSGDGTSWSALGDPVRIDLGDGAVYVGLAACSHTFGGLGEARLTGWRLVAE